MIHLKPVFVSVILIIFFIGLLHGEEKILGKITVREVAGLKRSLEYVEFPFQLSLEESQTDLPGISAVDNSTGEKIACQVIQKQSLPSKNLMVVQITFPVSVAANTTKTFLLKEGKTPQWQFSDLRMEGEGLDLIIENQYYRADLSRRSEPEPKIHASGQIQELLIKMGYDQLLTNAEDRIHWAPNFKREEIEWYTTIAHWENPREYRVSSGDYLIQTVRRDTAPNHPEIMLTAVYNFYAGLPYFKFYSEMEFIDDLPLELLRNDEMTTDSMFTHVAFQRPDGNVTTVRFKERYDLLKKQPIEENAPWICFYNADEGFAFGTIRLRYDNSNRFGDPSPTYLPHTQIGEWLDRKYWNRRLIHDHFTLVPAGSRYIEENAYLVFKTGETDPLESIRFWAKQLQHPLEVYVYPKEEM